MSKLREAFKRLDKFLDDHRIKPAALSALPYIGNSLAIIIYGDELDTKISELENKTASQQQEIINKIEELMGKNWDIPKSIVAIGSGNAENILECNSGDIEFGSKHQVTMKHEYGGSAVNVTTRLLTMEHDVYSVITIGGDRLGNQIRDRLRKVAEQSEASASVLRYINSNEFFADGIETPSSTVIVSGTERTIFSQPPGKVGNFSSFMNKRLEAFNQESSRHPRVVMIGHIYADNGKHKDLERGECTIAILNKFHNRSLILANFGNSQIKHMSKFWEEHLSKINVFQLNIKEAKKFFQDRDDVNTLTDIIKWFKNKKVNAVITLDKFGAIATHRDYEGVIIAWPIISATQVKDTTGAGDAFAAGMASVLCENNSVKDIHFQSALKVARLWAAESCKHIGASGKCPNKKDIEEYQQCLQNEAVEFSRPITPIATMSMGSAYDILSLIDIAFP